VADLLAVFDDLPARDLTRLPSEMHEMAATFHKVKVVHVPGTDHVVLGCSLAQRSPVAALRALVMTAGFTALSQLAMGAEDPDVTRPIRGGIDVAPGELLDNFLYTPALIRCGDLEHDARYARIVVGQRVFKYLAEFIDNEPQTMADRYHQSQAVVTRKLFFVDRDGAMVLDFMGEAVRATGPETSRLAGPAWKYVNHAHADARSSGHFDVAAKYAWLLDYMRERLPLWGINP
jgi:hypothetical protein